MNKYIQYGCGWSAPEGWTNFDSSPTLRFERIPLIGQLYTKNETRFPDNVKYGDVVRGLPIENGEASGIYASHILEHLSRADFETALSNVFNMLKSGGVLRLIVPDLEGRARHYIESLGENKKQSANDEFMQSTYLGKQVRPRSILAFIREYLGANSHLWMWDQHSIKQALQAHGFTNIRRCDFNDCHDEMFTKVEEETRFYWTPKDGDTERKRECAFEAIRP